MIAEVGQSEAYSLATLAEAGRNYHVIVDNTYMFSCETLIDSIIDIMCYYYVLNISYPKVMHNILIFFQHFIFGVTMGTIPTSVINLCSKLQ